MTIEEKCKSRSDSTVETTTPGQRSDLVDALARLVVKQHRRRLAARTSDESAASKTNTAKSKPKTRHMK